MAGLNFRNQMFGGATPVNAGPQARKGSVPQPTTASQAAWGTSLTASVGAAALMPNDAGGLAIWVGLAGVAALALIYYSLPGE